MGSTTDADDIVLRGCCGWNPRANAVRIGWALNSHIGDLTFSHCDFAGMDDSAVLIHRHAPGRDGDAPLCYTTVRFEHCTFDDVARQTQPLIKVDGACIRRLEFVNVAFDTAPSMAPEILGGGARGIQMLRMESVRLGGKPLSHVPEAWRLEHVGDVVVR